MVYGNKSAFRTPLIGRVVYLNKQLAHYGRLLPSGKKRKTASGEVRMTVDIRRYYFTPLLEKGNTLFVYAMRQLKGKDYLKRSVELIEEIQAQCFRSLENAYRLQNSLNSYIGFMCHTRSFNIQRQMMQMVLESGYSEWLYFKVKQGMVICKVKDIYKPKTMRRIELQELSDYQKQSEYEFSNKHRHKHCA